jgi:hypothetical protein
MARGWESKAVESQQDDARREGPRPPAVPQADRDRQVQRRSLELALANAQAELGAACRPAHKDMLRQKLAAIQAALAALP